MVLTSLAAGTQSSTPSGHASGGREEKWLMLFCMHGSPEGAAVLFRKPQSIKHTELSLFWTYLDGDEVSKHAVVCLRCHESHTQHGISRTEMKDNCIIGETSGGAARQARHMIKSS